MLFAKQFFAPNAQSPIYCHVGKSTLEICPVISQETFKKISLIIKVHLIEKKLFLNVIGIFF